MRSALTNIKHIRKIIAGIALLVAFLFAVHDGMQASPETPQYLDRIAGNAIAIDPTVTFEYGKPIQVAHAVDGDTVQLISGDYVRYIGIDTPEEFDPRKPVQCYAKEAADENRRLVQGQYVVIQKDVTERDKYGRLLGYIYLSDGTFVNKLLVEEGFAFEYYYKPDISKSNELKAVEATAKEAKKGLWSACEVRTLSGGRKQTNDLP